MNVYVETADHAKRQRKVGTKIRGRVAMYALMVEQRRYSGGDVGYAQTELERAFADRDASELAPQGTAFLYRTESGDSDDNLIWIVREDGSDAYFGPRTGYAGGD